MEKSKNKAEGRTVKIKASEVTQKEATGRYSKFQLWICRIFNIIPLDHFKYLFKVEYFGSVALKVNDLVINEQKVVFMVVKENNRLAMLVSAKSFSEKPKMYGSLTIISRKK